MDKPRHPQVVRTWKVERLKQRAPAKDGDKGAKNAPKPPQRKSS